MLSVVKFYNGRRYNPTTLDELLELKQQFPSAKIVAGNTEIGIEQRFGKLEYAFCLLCTYYI